MNVQITKIKEEKVKKNIFQKLLEVRKTVPYIQKGAKSFGYNYTKESQILGAIREKMDEEGVWLDMEMLNTEDVSISVYSPKDKKYYSVAGIRIFFEFTWTNCEDPTDKIVRHKFVQDAGSDVKTIGSLETYANKYFLLKFFSIPNDNADPDQFEKIIESSTTKNLSEEQIKEVASLLNGNTSAWKVLKEKFGYDKVSSIKESDYSHVVTTLKLFNMAQNGEQNEV